ncbi:MAG TPA: hypothetical protein VH025_11630 [Solirubrobacteraceae bacterium]|jgi:hypothetical protein|nr:hypothetical protein [Solirubrobacteraceae bacterium]
MRRILIGGVCAMALCALVGVSAASAAEPAFFECAKVTGGKYKDGKCSTEGGKGGHEFVESAGGKAKFVTTSFSPFVPSIAGGKTFCQKFKTSGEVASGTTIKHLIITQSGCEGGPSKMCSNVLPEKKHTIVTNSLEATLGYIDAAEHRIGIDLRGEGGGHIEDFDCEGYEQENFGSAIGELTPGPGAGQFTISLTTNPEGFQSYTSLEGGAEDVPLMNVNGTPFTGSLSGTITITAPKLVLKG